MFINSLSGLRNKYIEQFQIFHLDFHHFYVKLHLKCEGRATDLIKIINSALEF